MKLDAQVLIVGGGLAGNTLAGLLAAKNLDCIVIEAGSQNKIQLKPTADPRALALTYASQRILKSFGAWQQVPENRLGHFRRMQVWDENGKGEVNFDSADICQPRLGFILEQSVLQDSLQRSVSAMPSIRVCYDSVISQIEWHDEGISVLLENGQKLSAKLLVGADGGHSKSRELAGINSVEHDYRQHALACLVQTTLPHEDVARQRFLSKGPLAFLPMHNARECGVVWSTQPQHAQELLSMDKDEFNLELAEAFEYRLGEIKKTDLRSSFPLRRAQADVYCKERFALIGDAAHSVHPLAGQGANLGLLDAASLAQLVLKAQAANRDIAGRSVLRAYERWRKFENKIMMMTLEGFKYTFENQSGPVPVLRNRALDFANSIVPLKHSIMRHAMGLNGDLPELAKGSLA
ncbi:MAG: hypothetical protein GKR93_03625 [Gammaproteobacteria bacterium]|nr:hypothetical protein [Gammaproteobacteria bacterium]